MAPEIALRKPYNQKCDVFSFSMLFYEMITLEFLFPDYRIKDYYTRVCQNEERPTFSSTNTNTTESNNTSNTTTTPQEGTTIWNSLPPPIQKIIEEGWSVNPSQRPDMKRIGIVLRGLLLTIVAQLEESSFCIDADGNCGGGLQDGDAIRNRTQHMMHRSHASTTTSSGSVRSSSVNDTQDRPTSRCVNSYGTTPARTVGKNKKNQHHNTTTNATTNKTNPVRRVSHGIVRSNSNSSSSFLYTNAPAKHKNPNDAPGSSRLSRLSVSRGESVHYSSSDDSNDFESDMEDESS